MVGEEQRCWHHKLVNVLDALPKKEQDKAGERLKAMPYADTKADCETLRDEFVDRYKKTDKKAVDTLLRDWDRMVTFDAFPKEHWRHLRTTNIVESPFSSVRLRTDASRRSKRVDGAKAINRMRTRSKLLVGCAIMALLLTLSAVSCTHAERATGHWGYEGTSGPEYWAQLSQEYAVCREGRAQSPIDITDAIPSSLAHPQFFYQNIPLRIRNTGHTVQVADESTDFMQVGTSRYDLVELHFHRPSGHKVNGRSYDMEVRLVHRGIDGERAVVGVFMEISERDNPVIKKMWDYLPADDREEHLVDQGLINPEELLPANRSFYHYSGSLTTPPCSEGVKWYIMKHLIKVSEEQVARFSSLYRVNARPVQPSNGRVIQSSIR